MGINAVTYYEAQCDRPGCGRKSADLGDYSAWSDHGSAVDEWINSDGYQDEKTGELFCYEHRPALCVECDEPATGLDKDDETVCAEHEPVKPLPSSDDK